MSLRTKIVLFNAFVLALVFLTSGVAIAGFWHAVAPLRQAVVEETRSVELAEALRAQLAQESSSFSIALATGGTDLEYRSANDTFDQLLAQAAPLAVDEAARQALAAARNAENQFNQRAEQALARRDDPRAALQVLAESVVPARDDADRALARFLARQETAARDAERQAAKDALVSTAAFAALLAAAGVVGAILGLRLSRHLLERLSALVLATGLVAIGDREVRVPAPAAGGDEVDHLASSFNQMVAQLAHAEETARQVDEMKASFLASISHDLRTPLTTVKGLLETLRREDVVWDEDTRKEFLAVAAEESERLTALVANVLDLSRLEGGVWRLDRELVSLPRLAKNLVSELSVAGGPLARRAVRLVTPPHPACATAWADEIQVRRVLQNLLTNAAKFSPPHSAITVWIESGADSLTVRVQDEGPGVAPADREHIFEKFYRARPARPPAVAAATGTGLGLAICHGIVEAHGGRIWVEEGESGTGAVFSFTLPVAQPKLVPPAPRPSDAGAPARSPTDPHPPGERLPPRVAGPATGAVATGGVAEALRP